MLRRLFLINLKPYNPHQDVTLWLLMFLEGMVILAPWNAILTALEFFSDQYNPNNIITVNVYSYMPLSNFLANIIFQYIASVKGQKVPYHIKFTLMNLLLGASFITLPFIAKYGHSAGQWLLYAMVFVNGSFNAILQASVFGLGGLLPFNYTIAIMAGNGVIGLLLGAVRMICLACFPAGEKGEWEGTMLYFVIALVLVLAGIAGFFLLKRNSLVKSKIDSKSEIASTETISTVWWKIFVEAIIVFLTFVITFLVFPAVALNQTLPFTNKFPTNTASDWNNAILATIFNLFDTIGRFLPIMLSVYPKDKLYILLSCRCIFVVSFSVVSLYSRTWACNWFLIVNMVLFAFTNGYSSSLSMGFGPTNVADENKGIAGNLMSFHLIIGIFVGTAGGVGIYDLLQHFIKRRPGH